MNIPNEIPKFSASSYSTRTVGLGNIYGGQAVSNTSHWPDSTDVSEEARLKYYTALMSPTQTFINAKGDSMSSVKEKSLSPEIKNRLRVVRVFLVAPDDRLPVDKRVLFRSEEMTTDATDQELFFGIDVKKLLDAHNKTRAETEWEQGTKTKKGLKEIRIRDLVMSVTTIAEFATRAAADQSGD